VGKWCPWAALYAGAGYVTFTGPSPGPTSLDLGFGVSAGVDIYMPSRVALVLRVDVERDSLTGGEDDSSDASATWAAFSAGLAFRL